MSHFATYECRVSNLDYVKKALSEMGFSYRQDAVITDFFGQQRQVQLAIVDQKGNLLPIGWTTNKDNELELQADWYKVPISQREFVNKVSQLHTKYQILDACEENRWTVNEDDITVNENGEIEILATQWA